VQAFNRRETILGDDAPGLAAEVVAARTANVEPPRGDAAARAGLDEHFHDEAMSFPGQRPLQRESIALLDDDARDALRHHGVEKLPGLIAIRGRGQQLEPPRAVHRRDRRLDGLEKGLKGQLFGVCRRAHGHLSRERGECGEGEQEEQKPYRHCNGAFDVGLPSPN
jgi:hypothetical protein